MCALCVVKGSLEIADNLCRDVALGLNLSFRGCHLILQVPFLLAIPAGAKLPEFWDFSRLIMFNWHHFESCFFFVVLSAAGSDQNSIT